MTRRVVVTGLGMLSPLGVTTAASWEAIAAGKSGIRPIESFNTEGFAVRFGGNVPEFDLEPYIPRKEARRMDGFIQYGLVAGIQAVADAVLAALVRSRPAMTYFKQKDRKRFPLFSCRLQLLIWLLDTCL